MPKTLFESQKDGLKARIRLLSAGHGSSGYYSPEVIERDGAKAFPAGSFLHYDHITENDKWERKGSRTVESIVGKLLTDAEYVTEEQALYADAIFYSFAEDRVRVIAEDIALSIEASGTKDDDTGEIIELLPNPHNAIALVPRGGRDGKITEFLESRELPESILVESATIEDIEKPHSKESITMTPEEIKAALAEALAPALTAIATLAEAIKPVEKPEDTDAPKVGDVVEALIKADLPEALRTRVYESSDPIATLESIQSIRESLQESDKGSDSVETHGRVQESGTAPTSFLSTAWTSR